VRDILKRKSLKGNAEMANLERGVLIEAQMKNVVASFGRRQLCQTPTWEIDLTSYLKGTLSHQELLETFARFSTGENAFEMMMRRVLVRALCKQAGSDIQIGPSVVLKHPETMSFGACVFLGAQAMIQGRIDGTCDIGSHVWIGPQSYLDARNLILEDYVGWGPGAKVLGSVHSGVPVEEPVITTDLMIKRVVIGFGADIGMNASILPGVRIGAHAIVGAGAVVTHDVPPFSIVAGVPARFIRDRRKP